MSRRAPLLLAVTLAFGPAAHAAAPEPGMRLQDAVSPLFVAGPKAEPGPALDAWLDAHPDVLVRLPFTVWRGPLGEVSHAAIGAHERPPARSVRLHDAALGVSLADRLRGLCGDRSRCLVSLTGLWEPGRLDLRGIPTPLEGEGPWPVSVARKPSCLVVRVQRALHCARGPTSCDGCREAAAGPAVPKLLDLCPEGDVARPVVTFERAGRTEHRVYDVLRSFPTLEAARAFATEHGIELLPSVEP